MASSRRARKAARARRRNAIRRERNAKAVAAIVLVDDPEPAVPDRPPVATTELDRLVENGLISEAYYRAGLRLRELWRAGNLLPPHPAPCSTRPAPGSA